MHRWIFFVMPVILGAVAGCSTAGHQESQQAKVHCQYQAISRPGPIKKPSTVFVFPPLLADSKGKPLEMMKPRHGPGGEVIEWDPPSAASRTVRNGLRRELKKRGYQVVEYGDVLNMERSHSILVISALYSKPFAVESAGKNAPDTGVLTMLRAKTFDLDLDPAKSVSISDLDGLTLYRSEDGFGSVVDPSFSTLLGWLGDNSVGIQNISHLCSRKPTN